MTTAKSRIIYFGGDQEMVERVRLALSRNFEVTGVTGVIHLDDALNAIRRIKPDYVLVDPHLRDLNHQQLHRELKADQELTAIQVLVISEDEVDL